MVRATQYADKRYALCTDSSAAQKLSYNPEHHERVKHIDRRHFYIRDLVEDHVLTVPYVATAANMADLRLICLRSLSLRLPSFRSAMLS
mmetsp:Transcript_1572/g.3990  ORF Transcript_1572/g.3990 Transcript_1572/m.3990 type:complete len:89 (+) Transcript_1572:972-1238(+)